MLFKKIKEEEANNQNFSSRLDSRPADLLQYPSERGDPVDIRAAVFDLDGTLLDSIGVWHEIDVAFLAKRGLALPDDYVQAVAVMHLQEAAEYTVRRFSLPEQPEALVTEWKQMAHDAYARTVPLKPGAAAYIADLRRRGVRLAVATALVRELAEAALTRHGLLEMFDTLVYAAEVGQGKSSPAVFCRVADELALPPAQCLVFEDTLAGVRSAKAAGMYACGMAEPSAASDRAAIIAAADGYFADFDAVPRDFGFLPR